MEILQNIIVFFAESLIVVLSVIAILITIAVLVIKTKNEKTEFKIENLNEKIETQTLALKTSILTENQLKDFKKKQKELDKEREKNIDEGRLFKSTIFVLDFLKGDIKDSATEHLRDEITTVLGVATSLDEVLLRVESPGGLVHGYGLAAAQLLRIREAGIPLTISVDQVAASGGYLMACTGNKIIASPFALIGSIGVVAQVPNFNKLLKKYDVDYKEYTAGDFKRTVSLFGEITEKGEEKFKEQLEATHNLFKDFVSKYRPNLDLGKVATGEYWYGKTAKDLGLIDEIKTSDEYVLEKSKTHRIVRISFEHKPTISDKLSEVLTKSLTEIFSKILERNSSAKNV